MSSEPIRILIVDDEEGVRRTLELILMRKGFDVMAVRTAEEALRAAEKRRFNVALVDIRLPDGCGVELLKPLRSRHPNLEPIMMTGHASTGTAMQALNAGAAAYITKPLNLDEVLAEVGKILEKQRVAGKKWAAENQVEHINAVLRAISSVKQLIVCAKDRARLIQGACDGLVETRGYLSAAILLRDGQGAGKRAAAAGLPEHVSALRRFSQDEWLACGRLAIEGGGVVITKGESPECRDCPLIALRDCDKGMVASLAHAGRVYGVLMVTVSGGPVVKEEVSLLQEVADDIGLGLHGIEVEGETRRINAELEEQTTQLEWLTSIQSFLTQATSPEEILTAMAMIVDLEQLPAHIDLVYFEPDARGEPSRLRSMAIWEDGIVVADHPSLGEWAAVSEDPLARMCLRFPEAPILLSDVATDPRADGALRAYADDRGYRSALLLPLRVGGRHHGLVRFLWVDQHPFSRGEQFYAQQLFEPLSAVVASRRADRAQQRSESRYRALFNNATDAIIIHDGEGSILEVNQVACDQLGYSRDRLLTLSIQEISAEEQPAARLAWIQDLEPGKGLTFETVHVRGDGTGFPVEVSSRLIEYGGGWAILSAARDISDRLAMAKRLHRQERLAAVGQLAGGIAHDFRNFLTTIILYAGIPLAKLDISPETRHALQVITHEAQQASDLIQQILDFSGRSAMEMQPVNLADFIEEAAGILRQTIPESIRVSLAIEPLSSVVEADPTRIQQVLMNLVLNARDAMTFARGDSAVEGGELEIALSELAVSSEEPPPVVGMEAGQWMHLTVSDTGIGMDESTKERIFEPFFTTKTRGEGTGLGLAQVYGIVQQHGGHIEVETELGVGTSFHVYLRVHSEEATEADVRVPSALPVGRGETILLVEDQDNLREAGHGMLSSLGYRVVTAADGQEALETLQGLRVDLLVTDVVMPNLGGKALVRILSEEYPDLPVIAVTGYTLRDEISGLKVVGFVEVLQKPFDARSLAEVVERVLRERVR